MSLLLLVGCATSTRKIASEYNGGPLLSGFKVNLYPHIKDLKDLHLHVYVYCSKKIISFKDGMTFTPSDPILNLPWASVSMPGPSVANSHCGAAEFLLPVNGKVFVEIPSVDFMKSTNIEDYKMIMSIVKADKYKQQYAFTSDSGRISFHDLSKLQNEIDISVFEVPAFKVKSQSSSYYDLLTFESEPSADKINSSAGHSFSLRGDVAQKRFVMTLGKFNKDILVKYVSREDNQVSKEFAYKNLDKELAHYAAPEARFDYTDVARKNLADWDEERAIMLNLKPCGLKGSIEVRIKDCNSSVGNFSLVTRSLNQKEVYIDLKSKLFWSGPANKPSIFSTPEVRFYHEEAKTYCMQEGRNKVDLPGVKWSLPSVKDFTNAFTNGLANVPTFHDIEDSVTRRISGNDSFTTDERRFWTADNHFMNGTAIVEHVIRDNAIIIRNYKNMQFRIRCVGKIK